MTSRSKPAPPRQSSNPWSYDDPATGCRRSTAHETPAAMTAPVHATHPNAAITAEPALDGRSDYGSSRVSTEEDSSQRW